MKLKRIEDSLLASFEPNGSHSLGGVKNIGGQGNEGVTIYPSVSKGMEIEG